MNIPTGGSYALNTNTGEYELVERTFDPAEAAEVADAADTAQTVAPETASEPTLPAKRAAKATTEE